MLKITSHSSNETKKFAGVLAKKFLARLSWKFLALIIALSGDLGSGKTTFIQGFLKELGSKKRITSPTFVIIKSYKLKTKSHNKIYHIDCYRISPYGGFPAGRQNSSKELLKLGFKEIINNPQNIVLIEWAEKIKKILPKKINWIHFEYGKKENERKITAKIL